LLSLRALGAAIVALPLVGTGVGPAAGAGSVSSSPLQVQPLTPRTVQCPPVQGPRWDFPAQVQISSDMYEAFAVSYSCASVVNFVRQLAAVILPRHALGEENHLGGVPGFNCVAYPDLHGHAYAGTCHRGTSEFGWNFNVIYTPTLLATPLDVQLHALGHGRYQLKVGNTSGIGSIDSFTWSPPSGLTITGVTGANGATCALAANGSIACRGKLAPPTCLCETNGGAVLIDFTASGLKPTEVNGHPVYSMLGNGHTRIMKMTPIPYLIPQTQGELKNSRTG
jgi:hypothetical protein